MSESNVREIIIEPGRLARNYWSDLWNYRELFYFLAWRDILVRYKQAVLGIAWSVLRPFLAMVVFTIIFGNIANLPSEGAPYAVMVFAALLPWQFFAGALSDTSNSLVGNSSMLTKVYFPRLIVPASAVIVNVADFIISLGILVGLMVWYRFIPDWRILTLPLFFSVALLAAIGTGLWLAALNVRYRDFRIIVPFLVQFGLLVSPVAFSSSVISEHYRFLYSLNPMVGVIDGFRWAIIGGTTKLYMPGFILSLVIVGLILISGIWYFRRTERTFADII